MDWGAQMWMGHVFSGTWKLGRLGSAWRAGWAGWEGGWRFLVGVRPGLWCKQGFTVGEGGLCQDKGWQEGGLETRKEAKVVWTVGSWLAGGWERRFRGGPAAWGPEGQFLSCWELQSRRSLPSCWEEAAPQYLWRTSRGTACARCLLQGTQEPGARVWAEVRPQSCPQAPLCEVRGKARDGVLWRNWSCPWENPFGVLVAKGGGTFNGMGRQRLGARCGPGTS